jgi:membrane-bound ClpP family serine protease
LGNTRKKEEMNLLLDPNVAYLMLVVGFVLGVLALFTPGTGILEIGALFAIFLAGYAVYNLPINVWALIVLLVGVIPFILAVRKFKQWYWLIPAIISMVVGSVFTFRLESGGLAIHPVLAVVVSIIAVVLMWFIGRKSLDAMLMQPSQDLGKLIGLVGEAKTDIAHDGTVYVGGEDWSARSTKLIPVGSQVKVLNREGLVLIVEIHK